MKHRIIPAILSGGAGTRLWPLSTESKPKQFHAIAGPVSLFTATLRRVSADTEALSFGKPIVLCNAAHEALVREHLDGAEAAAIVFEPVGRNTAAAAVIAAALSAEIDPDSLVLLLPADHLITDVAAFHASLARAAPMARERILAFGIVPSRPETGYGYIKSGAALSEGVFAIEAFHEKPDAQNAARYLAEGGYFWNAGMFLFSPRVLLAEFAASAAVRDAALEALHKAKRDGACIQLDAQSFARAPSLPLDVAVMEKTAKGAVAPCDIGWADVGSWDAVWRLSGKDAHGNALSGPVIGADAANTLVHADGVKVCVAGVSDLVVVATPEAVLVLPRALTQDVKALRERALKEGESQ